MSLVVSLFCPYFKQKNTPTQEPGYSYHEIAMKDHGYLERMFSN